MAQIRWTGSSEPDFEYGEFGFKSLIGASLSNYTYLSDSNRTVTLLGTNLTTSGDRLTGGTVQQITISAPDAAATIEARIDGLDISTDLISYDSNASNRNHKFWEGVLAGDTTYFHATGVDSYVSMLTPDMNGTTLVGDDDRVRGQFGFESYVFGDTDDMNDAYLAGGDLDFYGYATRVYGDVETTSGASILVGGDDRMILRAPVSGDFSSTFIALYGDARDVNGTSHMIGGNDLIDASNLSGVNAVSIFGDVRSANDNSRIFGGDDHLIGSATLRNVILGDADIKNTTQTFVAGDDVIRGGANDDMLYGDTQGGNSGYLGGNDTIYGGGGDDTLFGGNGDDRLDLGTGSNTAYGGNGDDYLRADANGVSTFDGGSGFDTISYAASNAGLSINLATQSVSGGWATNDTIDSIENVYATRHADNVFGSTERNDIWTAQGNDTIDGGGGGDFIYAGAGNDFIVARSGGNSYFGGRNVDMLSYENSDAGITVDIQANRAWGGYAAGDKINEIEQITGSDHADRVLGNNSANRFIGGDGDDMLYGRNGNDMISGLNDNDSIYGGNGNDRLYGGFGQDYIEGGSGWDQMWGGGNADTFHYNRGDGNDRIKDFQDEVDRIELDGFAFGFNPNSVASQVGSNVVYNFGGGNVLTVENITLNQLSDDVFVV